MDYWEAELALCQILGKALVLRVLHREISFIINRFLHTSPHPSTHLLQTQIAVIVAYLEVQAQNSRQLGVVLFVGAEQLHQADGQHEEAASLAHSHQLVIGLRGTCEAVAPVDLHALSTVQLQQLFRVHLGGLQETQIT